MFNTGSSMNLCLSDWHLSVADLKTKLLYLPGKCSPTTDLNININNSVVAPTQTSRILGVTLDSQLSLAANFAATSPLCRYMLHSIRRIRPLLTQKAAQVLVQALVISCLDYCNSLLAGLPARREMALAACWSHLTSAARLLSTNLSSLRLLRSSTPFTGYQWLPVSASRH